MAELQNAKHELFANEYIIDLNGNQAAIRAGYSEKTARIQASKLLSNPNISARIEELKAERMQRVEVEADWVIKELIDVYKCCRAPEPVMKWDYSAREMIETGEYTFDSKGAISSLQLLGKHIGMFNENKPVNVNVGVNIIDDIEKR